MPQPLLTESSEKTKQRAERLGPKHDPFPSFQGERNPLLQLQRDLGNQRVAQLIQTRQVTPEGKINGPRPRLTVGAGDDQYEQETNRVARHALRIPDSSAMTSLQQASQIEGEARRSHTLQSTRLPILPVLPLAAPITPFAQRQMGVTKEIEDQKDKEEEREEKESIGSDSINSLPLLKAGFICRYLIPSALSANPLPLPKRQFPIEEQDEKKSLQTNAVEHHAGLTSSRIVQRDGNPSGQSSIVPGPILILGPFTVTTFDGLLKVGRLLRSELKSDAAEVPIGEPPRTAADDLVKQQQEWEPFLQSKGSDRIDQATVDQATIWAQAFEDARRDLEAYKKAKARAHMENAAAEADTARAAVEAIPDQLADFQRSAFLAKRHELLEKLTHTLGTALQVNSALLEIHEKCMDMVGWLGNETSHVDELIEKFGPIAEAAHKVVATFEGLSSALTILRGGEGATGVDQATSKASAGLGLASATGSLTGIASAYMVYFGAVLSVGQECLKVVGVIIREHVHEFNKFYIGEGDLNSVDWSAEPGGREAFNFMVLVMHADSSNDIPTPVPEAVDKLMIDSQEEFEKGTGEEVPTKGFWFWKKTNPNKLKYWLIKNRKNVWAMLYGSISPPV